MASSRDVNKQQVLVAREISRVFRYIKIGILSARGNLRPWNDFLKHLQAPSAQAGWPAFEMRVFSNLWYFRSNYILIALALSLYSILTNIKLLLAILLISLVCIYVFGLVQMPLNLGNGVMLSRMQTIAIVAFVSLLILWNLNALAPAIFALCLSTSVILLHAALRHANVKARLAKAAQDMRMQFGDKHDGENIGEAGAEILSRMGVFSSGGAEAGEELDPESGILGTKSPSNEERSSIYDDVQSDLDHGSSASSTASSSATAAATAAAVSSAMMRARRQQQNPQQTNAPVSTTPIISPSALPRPGVKKLIYNSKNR